MKTCSRCQTQQPLSFFNKDRGTADGLYPQCKDCSRAACRRVYVKYNDKHVALKRAWKNANREKHRAQSTAYQKADPARDAARTAAYKAAIIQATPPWADRRSLKMFKADCPRGWHLDHIEPIRAKDRCGLNVVWNLQYLPAAQSRRKGNCTDEDIARGGYYL